MKTRTFLFGALAACAALTACSSDNDTGGGAANSPVTAQIRAGVEATTASRAVNNLWEADEIGVMVTGGSNEMQELYRNVKYATTANQTESAAFTAAAGEIYFQGSSGAVAFAAYAPYQLSAANNVLPGTDGVIENISTADQSTRELQKAFDYIYASGATATMSAPEVAFRGENAFTHRMARLIVVVKTGDGFAPEDVADGTYTLKGLKHSGTFNVTTGAATATGEADTAAWSLNTNSLLTPDETRQRTYTSIVFPQDLSQSPLTFTAELGGQRYANSSTINANLEAGKSYVYTITANKAGLEFSSDCSITDWEDGATGSGSATM